ncbi:MAG: phytanoyl-CoA dioxygenase family protein [Candidatus Poribacteria bacterium]|nr:phytanoyl-CoA dioxygenase family protein [Candidatus Poribacteria bacterium]
MINEFTFGNLKGIRAAYDRDGCVVVRNVLEADLVEELDRHIDWLIERHPELRPERLGHWLVAKDPFWVRFVSDHRLLDVAEALVGPNIAFFAADYIAKPPRDGQAVLWHQDGNYWALEPMEVITIWFAVSKSTCENGCVRVIPGSHRLGPIAHRSEEDSVNLLNSRVDPGVVDESAAVDVELNPGDVSVHHPRILHGSETNTSEHWRRGGSLQYMPATTQIKANNWPCAFLFRGEAIAGLNHYQPRPRYVAGEHMPFKGCEAWA